jgi:hypothetical protein
MVASYKGVRILELANKAYSIYLKQNHHERANLLRIVLSYCTLKDAALCPTYKKPFDMLAKGLHVGNWRPQRDSKPRYSLERAKRALLTDGPLATFRGN